MALLELENFSVFAGEKEIVKGISLEIGKGEVHVIMGQNGAGKTTLLSALAGNPRLCAKGRATFEGKDLALMKPHERAKAGILMAFQSPYEIAGVPFASFLRRAYSERFGEEISVSEFGKILSEKMRMLEMGEEFATRSLNEGFSGGEKKKSELLQLAVLEPKLALVDELDSGLDVDGVKKISEMLAKLKREDNSLLIVTHYARLLRGIKLDAVHIMRHGKIVLSGDERIAKKIDEEGYGWVNRSVWD
ncbi:MAG: Fe-S cluster assembly ATPase SufC [Candidatus Anstonellaceae archaeon]